MPESTSAREEEILGERDAAAGGAGIGELLHDFRLGGHGLVADDVGLGLLGGDADARILDQLLFDAREPALELFFADDLGQDDLELDGAGGLARVGGKGVDDQLDRIVLDELPDLGRLGLLAGQNVLGRKDLHA